MQVLQAVCLLCVVILNQFYMALQFLCQIYSVIHSGRV